MGPKCSAKVLSTLPKQKVDCYVPYRKKKKKKHQKPLFNQLHSDMSYGAAGPESNFSKSTVAIKKCLQTETCVL